MAQDVTRKNHTTAAGDDRRVLGARPSRAGLIIENGLSSPTLFFGFGGEEVTPSDYSISLAPGERYVEMGTGTTPATEIRLTHDGSGIAHVTEILEDA